MCIEYSIKCMSFLVILYHNWFFNRKPKHFSIWKKSTSVIVNLNTNHIYNLTFFLSGFCKSQLKNKALLSLLTQIGSLSMITLDLLGQSSFLPKMKPLINLLFFPRKWKMRNVYAFQVWQQIMEKKSKIMLLENTAIQIGLTTTF